MFDMIQWLERGLQEASPMPHCIRSASRFSNCKWRNCKWRNAETGFQSIAVTGNDWVSRTARLIGDFRGRSGCWFSRLNLLYQPLHAPCPGHQGPDDRDELRHEAAPDRDTLLVGASVPCLLVRRQRWHGRPKGISVTAEQVEALSGSGLRTYAIFRQARSSC